MYRMGFNIQLRFLVHICVVAACVGFFMTELEFNGTLEPMDPEMCKTQNITFTCTLESPRDDHSLGFAIKNLSTNKEYVPIEESLVLHKNSTVAKLTLYNITSKFLIKCFYWDEYGNVDDDTKQIGYTSTVTVYPMPVELEEINCMVDNYLEAMNCSWNTGRPHEKNLEAKVIFQWRIPSFNMAWNDCPQLNEDYRYCFWPTSNKGDFTLKVIEIQLTQVASCEVNKTSNFTVDTSQIVKPRPVTGLTSSAVNSTCIHVQWSTNQSHMEYIKMHTVNISNKWDEPRIYAFNTTYESEQYIHNRTFCNLHPYTKYTFSVSLLPIEHQAGFYSDSRQTEAWTYSDIPGASPEVVSGGFSWNPQDCKTKHAVRRICVPLEPIKPIDYNGQMKGLVVTYVNEQTGEHHVENLAEDLKYVCKSMLMCNTSYKFYIKARNGNGTSKMNTSIEISASTLGIKQPQFIVEAGDSTNVTVTWPESGEAKTFLVLWCRNRNGQCQEKEDFNWVEFSGNTTEATIHIQNTNSPQDFLYGVSVLTDKGSSGFTWQECVYLKNADPQREVKNLAVSPGPEDNSLVVTWDKLTCRSDQPYIEKYNIRYNKVNDKHSTSVNVSASGEARKVLYNLERDQSYNVTVRAVTKMGQYGPIGQSQIGKPVDKSLRSWMWAVIIISVLVGVVAIVIIVIVCMRKYRQAKKSLEDAKKIKIPADDAMDVKLTLNGNLKTVRQNSDDSGYDPMTPTPDKYVEQPSYNNSLSKQDTQFQLNPDGYCIATILNSQTSMKNNITQDEPVAPAFIDANVDFTESIGKTDRMITVNNETEVKQRVKNDSGDSGMSETLAKEIDETSETDVKSTFHEIIDEKNSNEISGNGITDYVSAGNASDTSSIIHGNRSLQNRLSLSTVGGSENRAFVTDFNNSSKASSNITTSPDYVRAHADNFNPNTQSSYDFSQSQTFLDSNRTTGDVDNVQSNFLNNDGQSVKNFENKGAISLDKSVPLLTVIPKPLGIDESELVIKIPNLDSAIVKTQSLNSLKTKDGQHLSDVTVSDDLKLSDYVQTTDAPHIPDNKKIFLEAQMLVQQQDDYVQTTDHPTPDNSMSSRKNFPEAHMVDHKHPADYVQTTAMPGFSFNSTNISDKKGLQDHTVLKSDKVDSLARLPIEFSPTLPSSTSDQSEHVSSFKASNVSVNENVEPTLKSMDGSGPDCSNPVAVSSDGYVSTAVACQKLQLTNIGDHSISSSALSYSPTSSASSPVSSNDNVNFPNAIQSQALSLGTRDTPECSANNGNSLNQFQNPVYHPASNGNNTTIISDGYVVYSDDNQTLEPSVITSNGIPNTNNFSAASPPLDISGYVLTTNISNTSANRPLESSEFGGQSRKKIPQTEDCLDTIVNNTTKANGFQVPISNGYVDQRFLSNENAI